MDIKIGADPEVFVKDSEGKLISAYGLIPGTKADPHKVAKGAVQVDGMALEFNIEPALDYEQFENNINTVLNQLKMMVPDKTIVIEPTAEFGRELIDAQPDVARELGCDPDFNAYTGNENPKPNGDVDFRTASGHIHVGWTDDEDPFHPEHFEACRMMTKQLDVALGLPSKLYDRDDKRRTLYGALGSFRPKPYGMEYRVLSNAWLRDPALIRMVADTTILAVKRLLQGTQYWQRYEDMQEFFKTATPSSSWGAYEDFGSGQGYNEMYAYYLEATKEKKNKDRKAKVEINKLVGIGLDGMEHPIEAAPPPPQPFGFNGFGLRAQAVNFPEEGVHRAVDAIDRVLAEDELDDLVANGDF